MKILLTGASSYVGARLFLDLSKKFDVIGTYHGNQLSSLFIPLDTTNPEDIKTTLEEYHPDVIIHAAANANARWCEANPELAIQLNQESTKTIAESASTINAKVILVSSFAAVDHTTVYGQTKLKSEEYVKGTKAGYVILQPSLIIGFSPNTKNDRPFNRILKNLDEDTEAIYDTSWKFQPTYLGHMSEVIQGVLEKGIVNQTIPVAVKDLKSRFDIAKDILTPFNIEAIPVDKQDTSEVVTDDLHTLADLELPQYAYSEIIEKIVEEIKNRDSFKF